jgi:hypothetical protein
MARLWSRLAAVATAALLAIAGVPSMASAAGARPAPIDPAGGHLSTRAPRASSASRPSTPNELLAKTLAEEEDDDGDDNPAISALCQDYLGSSNPYGPVAPNVDVIQGDTVVATGSQTGCESAQNETTIATNPYNPKNLVAGSNDYRVYNAREARNDSSGYAYSTFDGGKTWTNVQLPHLTYQTGATGALSDMDSAGDPVVAFGPNNTVYYANIVFSRLNGGSGITVSVSHNGGLTWEEPSVVQLDGVNPDGTAADTNYFNDKEWIAADPASGTVYVTWTRFTYNPSGSYVESPIVVKKSTDYGQTWSAMTRIAPSMTGFHGGITAYDQGSSPQVGNDGSLYVAYEASVCATVACNSANDHDAVVVATSSNGGKSFKNAEASSDFDFPVNEDIGDSSLTGLNFRINSFPQLAYDRVADHLWITWADDRNGTYDGFESVKTNGDNFVIGSSDGKQWSGLTTVGTAQDEVFPGIAAVAGRVVVSYYTRHYDPNGIGLDYAMSSGWGRSVGAATVHRITTETENPNVQFVGIGLVSGETLQGEFIGDYTTVAMGADLKAHPCWTDFRGNPALNTPNQDVYTQSVPTI